MRSRKRRGRLLRRAEIDSGEGMSWIAAGPEGSAGATLETWMAAVTLPMALDTPAVLYEFQVYARERSPQIIHHRHVPQIRGIPPDFFFAFSFRRVSARAV